MESLSDFLRLPPRLNSRETIDTMPGAKYAASLLFCLIEKHHGLAAARSIFNMFGTPPSAARINHIKNLGLLDRYDMMKPKPNVQRLAKELAAENEKLSREERWGPRGTTDPLVLDKHIRRLIQKRKKMRRRNVPDISVVKMSRTFSP
jgi:hypothetical protein